MVGVVTQLSIAGSSGLLGDRYDIGELIQFQVVDESTCWWCCCEPACDPTMIHAWRVARVGGPVVYSVQFDAQAPALGWVGNWSQVDMNGMQVSAGNYILYVDTSIGTLSRCFRIVDPCCWNFCWWCCSCSSNPCITQCYCKTSLEWVYPEPECCWPCWPCCP
jgi:hypothetical protein